MPKAATIVFKDALLRRFIKGMNERFNHVSNKESPFVSAISARVFRDIISHFDEEMGPEGKWDPWSVAYAAKMKRRGKSGNKILQDTGNLRQNFKETNWRKKSEGIEWYNDATAPDGEPYAWKHNQGPSTSEGNPRPFMWLSERALEDTSKLTLAYIMGR